LITPPNNKCSEEHVDFSKIVDWIKLSPRHYFAVLLASGSLLFLPDNALGVLGLVQLRATYRGWIGSLFVLSAALLLSHPLAAWGGRIGAWLSEKEFVRVSRKRLLQLTPVEKKILRGFVAENTRTQTLNFMDGVVSGLESAHIIYRASNAGTMDGSFAYNMQPWAWEQLKNKPELLK